MMGAMHALLAATTAAPAPARAAGAPAFDWSTVDWAGILLNWGIALVIVVVGMWLSKRLSLALERALTRARVESTLSSFLRNVSYAVLLVLVFVSALTKIGVPATSLATVLGAAGLAVGFWKDLGECSANWSEDKRWEPQMDQAERERQMRLWKKAVTKSMDWVDEDVK